MRYITDPTTGQVVAHGGLIGVRTLDDRRAEANDFDTMLERRASVTAPKPPSWRKRHDWEWLQGGVRNVRGDVACPECAEPMDGGFDFCTNCGNPLNPLGEYGGVQSGDTLKCDHCGRMNTPSSNYCSGCGYSLLAEKEEESKSKYWPKLRPRSVPVRVPARGERPAGSVLDASLRGRGMVEATKTCDVRDPITGNIVHVIAGRTHVASGSWLHKLVPNAFRFAA